MPHTNLAVELLQRLIKDEIKTKLTPILSKLEEHEKEMAELRQEMSVLNSSRASSPGSSARGAWAGGPPKSYSSQDHPSTPFSQSGISPIQPRRGNAGSRAASADSLGSPSVFDAMPSPLATPHFGLQPPSAAPSATSFDRIIDPNIIKISCKEMFSVVEATRIAKIILEEGGINPESMAVEGGKVNNRFSIRLRGGAVAVRQCLDAQRPAKFGLPWKVHFVESLDKSQVPIYLNPDKNAKTTRTEIALKQLQTILKDKYPNLKDSFQLPNRNEGVIHCQWKKLIRVSCPDSSTTLLSWWGETHAKVGIDKALVEKEFSDQNGSGEAGSWS